MVVGEWLCRATVLDTGNVFQDGDIERRPQTEPNSPSFAELGEQTVTENRNISGVH
jgi:hypothetical protein